MTMHRYNGPTIPEEGLYAGKLYTEEERAEIRRRRCLPSLQRRQEDCEMRQANQLSVVIVVGLISLLFVAMTIAEVVALG